MHPYLSYLLDDIAAAHRDENEIEEIEYEPQTIEEYFEEIDRWLEGEEPTHTFGYYCGLEAVNFPPTEQLTKTEMELVCDAFRKMMFSWNLKIHFPQNLPVSMAYRITVDTLNSKTDICNRGFVDFDFCNGWAPDCIFKEYCNCLEIWDELDDDMSIDSSEGELPF